MKIVKNVLLLICFLALSAGVSAQGLYEKRSDDSNSLYSSSSSSSEDKPTLRAGGNLPPNGANNGAEPGTGTPVSGGFLILTALTGLYGATLYFGSKRKKHGN